MILGIGIDLCDCARAEAMMENHRFLEKYFAADEQAYFASRGRMAAQTLAGHFAAKEAGLKALGCGIVLPLVDIAVSHNASGAPSFVLSGEAHARMLALGGRTMHLSITHIERVAAAVAILEG